MNDDKSAPSDGNVVTIQGRVRWNSSGEQGDPGHFFDPVSGWRSDDPFRAVHEALALTTFRLLYEAFEAATHVATPPPDDTPQS